MLFYDVLWDILYRNIWMPDICLPNDKWAPAAIWFTYDNVEEEWERMGYPTPFPLSRAEFGKELANFVYHNRHRMWLRTERKTDDFGFRYRRYKLEPLGWWK